MNRLKTLSLIIYLVWNASAYAENKETGADNPFGKFDTPEPEDSSNPYSKYKIQPSTVDADEYKLPAYKPKTQTQSKPERVITEYYSSIKPGDKLPANVYDCALKNLRGIGSDTAAQIVWQACLRLHLK